MSSKEYYEGRNFECSSSLYNKLEECLGIKNCTQDGSTSTKADIRATLNGITIGLSCKSVSGANTQVHITTVEAFCNFFPSLQQVKPLLTKFFGSSNDWGEIHKDYKELSRYETTHKRINAHNIENFDEVVNELNKLTRTKDLPNLLLKSLCGSDNVKYLIWNNKKTKECFVFDIEMLIDLVSTASWQVTTKGTVIECLLNGSKIFWLQMKGNRIKHNGTWKGEYDHSMQFHINLPRPGNITNIYFKI